MADETGALYGGIGGALQGASAGSAFGPAGAVIGGVVGGIGGALLGSDDSSERIAKLQSRAAKMESEQRIKDMRFNMGQALGLGRASVGASNLQLTGSPEQYLNMLESNFRSEIAWEEMRGSLEQKMIALGADATRDAYRGSLASGAIGALTLLPSLKKTFIPEGGAA